MWSVPRGKEMKAGWSEGLFIVHDTEKKADRMGLHKSESQIVELKVETRKPVLTIGLKIKWLCESKM